MKTFVDTRMWVFMENQTTIPRRSRFGCTRSYALVTSQQVEEGKAKYTRLLTDGIDFLRKS